MRIELDKKFTKSFKKRVLGNLKLEKRYEQRLKLLVEDRNNLSLKDHGLVGKMDGYRSFAVTGDIRVIYREVGELVVLLDIGTHNQVYGK